MKINLSLRVLAVLFLSRESLHDATVQSFAFALNLAMHPDDARYDGRARNEAIGFTRLTIFRPLSCLDIIIAVVISPERS